MGTLCPETVAINRKKVVQELVAGKEFANQLQVLLQKPSGEDGSVSAQGLAVKILRSFTQTLSLLTAAAASSCRGDDGGGCGDQNQQQQDGSCVSDGRRLEYSGEGKKRRPGSKDKRGCYKRKKNSQTRTVISSTTDDGFAWRKYGQKVILNAKYPRSYFRCTHKYDQGCRAMKQVQRMDDDPQKLETIYFGNHTCSHVLSFPQVIVDSDPWSTLSTTAAASASASAAGASDSYAGMSSSSSMIPTQVKRECKEETLSTDDLSENLSTLDSIVAWDDLVIPDLQSPPAAAATSMNMVSLQMGSSVYSCNKMISSHSLASMDSFDHDFRNFDECFSFL